MNDKVFYTYSELIQHLRNHGVIINDESYATEVLQSRSYYGLINAFKHQYFNKEKNNNSEFKMDFNIFVIEYAIEDALKNLLLKYSLLAEIRLKEIVAHRLGEQYDTDISSWLDNSHFRTKADRAASILNEIRDVASTTNKNPTKYYRNEHDSIPPWILLPNLTIGQFKNLFSLLSPKDREDVCKKILYKDRITEHQKNYVKNGLDVLWEFRNTLAHGSSILNFKSSTKIPLTITQSIYGLTFVSKTEYDNDYLGANDILCFIGVLNIFLGHIDKKNFKKELITLFDSFDSVEATSSVFKNYYSGLKLPEDLSQRI